MKMNFLLRSFEKKIFRGVKTMQIRNKTFNLPRLPVPKLQDTLAKYLRSIQPFVNTEELAKTTSLVKEFLDRNGVGVKLQDLLEQKASKEVNWLSDWWLNVAYLQFRQSVVVYSSPGLVFPFVNFQNKSEFLKYTTKLIFGALSFKHLIEKELLPADKLGNDFLDMDQYKKIFGTCRIPGKHCDSIEFNPDSKHFIVAYKNNFFKIKLQNQSNALSENQLFNTLFFIVNNYENRSHFPIGILTALNRDEWYEAYEKVTQSDENIKSIKEIQKSLFIVCLDESLNKNLASNRQSLAAQQTIHGGGEQYNSANRWFDKTLQFIVSKDCISGLTYEHSPSEGQPIAVLTDHIINFVKDADFDLIEDHSDCSNNIELLNVQKDNGELENALNNAKNFINNLATNLDMECFTFDKFGKEFIKSQKLSPDSFIQIAMQYAFYKVHNVPGAHYESAATRKYKEGRTETIRSCSVESVDFAKKMLLVDISDDEKINAMKLAIDQHKKYTISAINGFGVDRHLLGLKMIALENNYQLPKLYQDESFKRSTHMRISSSQVATKCDGFMCYGPLVDNGYGCCYNPRSFDINFAISSFNSNQETKSIWYKNALVDSLMDMFYLLSKNMKSKL